MGGTNLNFKAKVLSMKDIAIFGAGGYGKEVACTIRDINEAKKGDWNIVGFFDDGKPKGMDVSHYGKVLGGMDELNAYAKELAIAIAIGSPKSLRKVRQRITNPNVTFPNIIAPNFGIADKEAFSIGEGNIIGGGCWASCDVSIGSYNILNADIVIGHDAQIGNYNVLMPDIRVSGEVSIGDGNLLGVGSIILQQIQIGDGVHLGAGAVLLTKPKNNSTYIGNPAKLFKY